MICNKRIKLITRIIVVCFIVINIIPPVTMMGMEYEPITAEYFFGEILNQLNIDISDLGKKYPYCSPQIAYLVNMGYITSYEAYIITEEGKGNTEFLINQGFLLVKYFDRPSGKGDYDSITERAAKETGLIEESFDCSKPLTYADADNIIYKLVNNKFKRIKYSTVQTKIPYKIYDFYNMSISLIRTLAYINMLPQICIDEFNEQTYMLKIVENASVEYPYNVKNVIAFIGYNTKEICIMRGYEYSILHEFGHLMSYKVSNWPSVCEYLYELEGDQGILFRGINDDRGAEEYMADVFSYIIMHQKNIYNFKQQCPVTYHYVWNILLKLEVNKKVSIQIPLNINVE